MQKTKTKTKATTKAITKDGTKGKKDVPNSLIKDLRDHAWRRCLRIGDRIGTYTPFLNWLSSDDAGPLFQRQFATRLIFSLAYSGRAKELRELKIQCEKAIERAIKSQAAADIVGISTSMVDIPVRSDVVDSSALAFKAPHPAVQAYEVAPTVEHLVALIRHYWPDYWPQGVVGFGLGILQSAGTRLERLPKQFGSLPLWATRRLVEARLDYSKSPTYNALAQVMSRLETAAQLMHAIPLDGRKSPWDQQHAGKLMLQAAINTVQPDPKDGDWTQLLVASKTTLSAVFWADGQSARIAEAKSQADAFRKTFPNPFK